MASATGIPQDPPVRVDADAREDEPLLGRPGDVTQAEDEYLMRNLSSGTAAIAQAGILILIALIWSAVLSEKIVFFSAHPMTNSAGVLLTTQAILLLQPTHTPTQKSRGALAHASFIFLAASLFIIGLTIVELQKKTKHIPHFSSPHAILGLITYILITLQALLGISQFFVPRLVFGSVERGKKAYKYHRVLGYVVLVMQLATIAAATQTGFNKEVWRVRLWTVLLAALLVVAGVGARVKKHKMVFW